MAKREEYLLDDEFWTILAVILTAVITFLMIIIGLDLVDQGISYILNPRYYALKSLLDLVVR